MAFYADAASDVSQALNIATDTLSAGLGGIVRSVRLDTAYLPPMDLVGGSGGIGTGPSGEPTFDLGSILKPKLTIQLAAGNPIVYAPYGDPGEGSWLPLIAIGGAFVYLIHRAGKRSASRR